MGDADARDAEAFGGFEDAFENDGVHVEMLVAVDVGEGQAGGEVAFELGVDFIAELEAGAAAEGVAEACAGGRGAKASV